MTVHTIVFPDKVDEEEKRDPKLQLFNPWSIRFAMEENNNNNKRIVSS